MIDSTGKGKKPRIHWQAKLQSSIASGISGVTQGLRLRKACLLRIFCTFLFFGHLFVIAFRLVIRAGSRESVRTLAAC